MAKKQKPSVLTKAKKKTSIARARIKVGMGHIKVNMKPLEHYGAASTRREIMSAVSIAEDVLGKGFADDWDVDVNVKGGGVMSQGEAVKGAMAKAFVEWTESDELKEAYLNFDRNMLVDDVRRKEAKKYLRKGARAKRQKSYR